MYSASEQRSFYDLTKKYLEDTPIELSTEQRLEELRQLINYHEWRYYIFERSRGE